MKDRIEKVYAELKEKGLVKSRLTKSHLVPNLKRSLISGIVYNPKYSHLDKDVIRFLILHEEGHGRIPIAYPIIFLVFIITTIIGTFITFNPVLDFILTFIVFFGILRLFIPILRHDEYKADQFAVDALIREYDIDNLEQIVKKALDTLTKGSKRKTIVSYIYILMPYHPSNVQRIEAVRGAKEKKVVG
ncbi:MAG: M48 family metalloprotease [Candidatus Woesearchaeota archaeon]